MVPPPDPQKVSDHVSAACVVKGPVIPECKFASGMTGHRERSETSPNISENFALLLPQGVRPYFAPLDKMIGCQSQALGNLRLKKYVDNKMQKTYEGNLLTFDRV